jgi:hypothetical protein
MAKPKDIDIIKEAYDKVGIEYTIGSYKDENGVEWSYLFYGDRIKEAVLAANGSDPAISRLTATEQFMEFQDGEIASY